MSKLAALLNMLASDFDGERANAARMIATMAKAAGKTVSDFVMSPQVIYRDRIVEKTVYKDRPEPKRAETYADDDLRRYRPHTARKQPRAPDDLIEGLLWALDFPEYLTGYEVEFCESVTANNWHEDDLSEKQRRVAKKIIAKVKAAEADPLI